MALVAVEPHAAALPAVPHLGILHRDRRSRATPRRRAGDPSTSSSMSCSATRLAASMLSFVPVGRKGAALQASLHGFEHPSTCPKRHGALGGIFPVEVERRFERAARQHPLRSRWPFPPAPAPAGSRSRPTLSLGRVPGGCRCPPPSRPPERSNKAARSARAKADPAPRDLHRALDQAPVEVPCDEPLTEVTSVHLAKGGSLGSQAIEDQLPAAVHDHRLDRFVVRDAAIGLQDGGQRQLCGGMGGCPRAVEVDSESSSWKDSLKISWRFSRRKTKSLARFTSLMTFRSSGEGSMGGLQICGRIKFSAFPSHPLSGRKPAPATPVNHYSTGSLAPGKQARSFTLLFHAALCFFATAPAVP